MSSDQKTIVFPVLHASQGGRLVAFDLETHMRRVLLNNISEILSAAHPIVFRANLGRDGKSDQLLIGDTLNSLKVYTFPVFNRRDIGFYIPTTTSLPFSYAVESSNIFAVPAVWTYDEHYLIVVGDSESETIISIINSVTGEKHEWRKLGSIQRLIRWNASIGVVIDQEAWLLNINTGLDLSLGKSDLVWDKDALVVMQPTGINGASTQYKIMNANGSVIASYTVFGIANVIAPLRSSDNQYAVTYTTIPDGSATIQYTLANSITGKTQALWQKTFPNRPDLFQALWLPDNSGLLTFEIKNDQLIVSQIDTGGEVVWVRQISGVLGVGKPEIISCSYEPI